MEAQTGTTFLNMSIAASAFAGAAVAVAVADFFLARAEGRLSGMIGEKLGHRMWFGRRKKARQEKQYYNTQEEGTY